VIQNTFNLRSYSYVFWCQLCNMLLANWIIRISKMNIRWIYSLPAVTTPHIVSLSFHSYGSLRLKIANLFHHTPIQRFRWEEPIINSGWSLPLAKLSPGAIRLFSFILLKYVSAVDSVSAPDRQRVRQTDKRICIICCHYYRDTSHQECENGIKLIMH